jgi:pimeloyl-ACP methyl ester carboxylesterase
MPISSFSPVEDLKALIDSLKLQGVTLIGSSSGGGVAVDFTLTYPHLVHKLVLVAPSINGIPFPIHMMWQGTKNFFNVRMKGRSSAIESFIRNHYWNYYFPSRDKELARSLVLKNVRNLNNFCRFPPQLSSVMKPSSATRLQDIHIPTLVIISDQEHPYNMKTAETLHHHIKHSSKISMQGCGHLPFIEEPQEFNHIVLEFLSNRSL